MLGGFLTLYYNSTVRLLLLLLLLLRDAPQGAPRAVPRGQFSSTRNNLKKRRSEHTDVHTLPEAHRMALSGSRWELFHRCGLQSGLGRPLGEGPARPQASDRPESKHGSPYTGRGVLIPRSPESKRLLMSANNSTKNMIPTGFRGHQTRYHPDPSFGPALPKTLELGKTAPVKRSIGRAEFCLPPRAFWKLGLGPFIWSGKVSVNGSTRIPAPQSG